jgi:hypothetical protein
MVLHKRGKGEKRGLVVAVAAEKTLSCVQCAGTTRSHGCTRRRSRNRADAAPAVPQFVLLSPWTPFSAVATICQTRTADRQPQNRASKCCSHGASQLTGSPHALPHPLSSSWHRVLVDFAEGREVLYRFMFGSFMTGCYAKMRFQRVSARRLSR